MPQSYPRSIQNAISMWWEYWGFKDNPFATSEAEQEGYLLRSAFIDTGKFEQDIYGDPENPKTVLFFASRGCGKTAHRRRLEIVACPTRRNREILTVAYTEFSFWRHLAKPMPEDHLAVIMALTVKSVLQTSAKLPKDRIDKLSNSFFKRLKHIFQEFSSETLEQIISDRDGAFQILDITDIESSEAFSSFVSRLLQSDAPKYSLQKPSYHTAIKVITDVVQELGPRSIYVLVDAVDEVVLEHSSWVDCIEPLLSDLKLMQMPNFVFKFFLPAEKEEYFWERNLIRPDKLDYAQLAWTKKDLQLLLSNRLKAFNKAGIDSLRMMCEPKLAIEIEDLLIEKSLHIPRNLLQLGQHLVATHCQNSTEDWMLTYDDWKLALNEAEKSPWLLGKKILEISPTIVTIDGVQLSLTKLEHDFLWHLGENGGVSDKESLIQAIYDTDAGVSDNSLSSLVKRLRGKLGDESKNHRYINTIHSKGFQLMNWRQKENG